MGGGGGGHRVLLDPGKEGAELPEIDEPTLVFIEFSKQIPGTILVEPHLFYVKVFIDISTGIYFE